jgi:hypothetical protein
MTPKIHESQGRELVARYDRREASSLELALDYNICVSTVYRVLHGESFAGIKSERLKNSPVSRGMQKNSGRQTYDVWFASVDQVKYTVSAKSREEAVEKARAKWRKDHAEPRGAYAEAKPLEKFN